jgi:hypothetical protein
LQRTDTHLLQLKEIRDFIRTLDRAIPDPGTDITLIVGAAVTLLCADDERQTDDIDTLAGSALEIAMQVGARQNPPVNVSARGDMFDNYLPEDWESRRRQVFPFSPGSHHLRVFVPCPEDLAVMKVFRFLAKDQDDLYRLAHLPDFDRNLFQKSFISVLRFSVGDKRRDALSFAQTWNALFTSEPPLDTDEVMRRAGLA